MKYPDKSSGAPSSGEQENYTVNALGEVKTKTDRNGNVHTYTRDVLGRQIADAVTTLRSGVDGAVRRLETAYDTVGRAYLFTSYDAATSGDVVNQVQREFNGLGQLITEYQSHSGAVNTSTTPKVQYAYSEMASSTNHSRLVSMTYPNGRVLNYNYASGLESNISRLSSLSDNSATLEAYSYLGLGTVVVRAHPEPDVDLTYVQVDGDLDANEDGGDQYTGLDRFGRVIDQFWWNNDLEEAVDRFQYGHDRSSNRTYRANLIDAAFSELYEYDDLNQLTSFARGELSDGNEDGVPDTVDDPTRAQSWDFDALGNFESQTTDGTPENRTHNKQNQVTGVGSSTLTFDVNGNMTTDEAGQQYVYDAWNRVVEVQDSESDPLVRYEVDALGRRVVEDSGTAHDLFYSADWQVLEERVGGTTKVQYVWSPVYVDAMVLRDRDADGQSGNELEERLYAVQDANFNVTALVTVAGSVAERFEYDPYGAVSYLTGEWGTQNTSSSSWVVLHQGGRYEPFSGDYHFRNRDLQSNLGRWGEVDPLGFGAGDPNLYRYLNNTSVNNLDPTGEKPWAGMYEGWPLCVGGSSWELSYEDKDTPPNVFTVTCKSGTITGKITGKAADPKKPQFAQCTEVRGLNPIAVHTDKDGEFSRIYWVNIGFESTKWMDNFSGHLRKALDKARTPAEREKAIKQVIYEWKAFIDYNPKTREYAIHEYEWNPVTK